MGHHYSRKNTSTGEKLDTSKIKFHVLSILGERQKRPPPTATSLFPLPAAGTPTSFCLLKCFEDRPDPAPLCFTYRFTPGLGSVEQPLKRHKRCTLSQA